MNTSLTAYTNLESLLLFQSLNVYGLANNAFSEISKLLKSNPCITSDRRFESGRLSPDALRNFCFKLLKEEEHSEQRQDAAPDQEGQNGQARNSRKRKAPSPTYPTVQEARQHAHLIPKLVSKLYARYRTAITNEIKDEEDKYERLQREVLSVERGERDNDLFERLNSRSSITRSPSLPRRSPHLQQKANPPSPSPHLAARELKAPATPLANAHSPDVSQAPPTEPQQISAPPNGPPNGAPNGQPLTDGVPRDGPFGIPSKVTPSTTPGAHPPQGQGSALPMHVQNQAHPPSPSSGPPPSQPVSAGNNVPTSLPPQFPPPSPYHAQPSVPQAQPPQGRPPAPSPHQLHGIQTPSHPSTLPPPLASPVAPTQGPRIHPQPPQPYPSNGTPHAGPIQGPPPQFAPPNAHFPPPYPPAPRSPHVHTPQAQRSIPYSGPPSYPPQQAQQAPAVPPPQSIGGIMLPPFQVSPQDPTHAQQPAPPPPVSTPLSRQPHPSIKTNTPASVARQNLPPLQPFSFGPRSSFSTPHALRTPQSGLVTPRSAKTQWKVPPRNAPAPAPRPDVSPIDDIEPEDAHKQTPVKPKVTRKGRSKNATKEKDVDQESVAETEPDEQVPEMETRQGRSRRIGASRRARPESLASSRAGGSIRERSRSHSIISHTETIGGETESQADTRVKTERGTSFDVIEEDVATPSQPATRRRGGAATRGRKRTAREASLAESEDHPPGSSPPRQRVVIAPRHFSRMCNPIMNDISSHKHASTFTTAVKAKNAEGYYDIIKRPTDLKSIQKAIGAGAKIVAAAATSDTPVGGASPGGGGGVVELPLSEDVIPPKAIVNSAQLENEIMRMFANAVMFNPGEDGIVKDAKDMFETCEKSVSSWRNVDRSTGGAGAGAGAGGIADDTASLAAGSEDAGEGAAAASGKRRKVG